MDISSIWQVKLDKHDGVWVKFHVKREESNGGKLILITKAKPYNQSGFGERTDNLD